MSEDRIAKLPTWARDHIKNLQRERDVAVRQLNEYVDAQTPSRIYYDDYVSTGEQQGPSEKRCYIQSNRVSIANAGVELDIYAHEPDRIRLQWSASKRFSGEVAMIPFSGQCVYLVAKENMR